MKVKASINRLTGAQNNIKNAIGFMEVQDGLLETVGRVLMRMSELKGYATQDPLKSDSDIASYNNEFKDLQVQLYQISQMNFNGASLFALYATNNDNPGATYPNVEAVFGASDQNAQFDHTLDIYTSSEGSEGTKVSIHKSLLLSALTLHQNGDIASDANSNTNEIYDTDGNTNSNLNGLWSTAKDTNSKQHPTGKILTKSTGALGAANNEYLTLAVTDTEKALDLYQVSAGVFEKAIENVVFLTCPNGWWNDPFEFCSGQHYQPGNQHEICSREN